MLANRRDFANFTQAVPPPLHMLSLLNMKSAPNGQMWDLQKKTPKNVKRMLQSGVLSAKKITQVIFCSIYTHELMKWPHKKLFFVIQIAFIKTNLQQSMPDPFPEPPCSFYQQLWLPTRSALRLLTASLESNISKE